MFEGSPAKAAGLTPGDIIQAVDGKSTKDVAIETSISRIKGEEGTTVTLTVQPKDKKQQPKELKVVRKTIEIPETDSRIINDKGTKVGYVQLVRVRRPGRTRRARGRRRRSARRAPSGSSSTCATTAAAFSPRPWTSPTCSRTVW